MDFSHVAKAYDYMTMKTLWEDQDNIEVSSTWINDNHLVEAK